MSGILQLLSVLTMTNHVMTDTNGGRNRINPRMALCNLKSLESSPHTSSRIQTREMSNDSEHSVSIPWTTQLRGSTPPPPAPETKIDGKWL